MNKGYRSGIKTQDSCFCGLRSRLAFVARTAVTIRRQYVLNVNMKIDILLLQCSTRICMYSVPQDACTNISN